MSMKKCLAICAVFFLVASVFGTVTGVSVEDDSLSSGSVAGDNPMEIYDWYDLNETRDNLEGDYVLMNDLDEDTDGYDELVDTEDGWEPIGDRDDPFRGEFDGQGNVIHDLYIDSNGPSYVGLFGATNESEIIDVGLEDVDIDGSFPTGGLVGLHRWNSKIQDSYVTGTIENGTDTGGLVGSNHRSEIQDSYAEVDVSGEVSVGGLVGFTSYSIIRNSYATGDVEGERELGGLVGVNRVESEIHNSYATGDVTGEKQLGGLVGVCWSEAEIHNSFASGDVTGEGSSIGGLVGTHHFGNEIHNSYAIGNVSGEGAVGGLVGGNVGSTVSNSYAIGEIDGDEYIGALIGYNINSTVEKSYADEETTGQADLIGVDDNGTLTESELLTTDEMTGEDALDNMESFDFSDVWRTVEEDDENIEEDGYPILQDLSREEQLKAQGVYYEEEDDGIPGFTSTLLLLAVAMAVAIYRKKDY